MLKLTPEKLKEIFAGLPEDVKDAVFSVDSSKVIQEIGEKKELTVDKIGELADEVGLVMFGLTHPKDFIANLSKRLEVDRTKAKEIAEEINTRLFSKIRESLKKVHGLGGKKVDEKTEIKGPAAMKKAPEVKKLEPERKPIDIKSVGVGFSDIKKEIDEKKINEALGEQKIDIDEIAPEKVSLEEEIDGIKEISVLREQEGLKEKEQEVSKESSDSQVIKKDLMKEMEAEEDIVLKKTEPAKPVAGDPKANIPGVSAFDRPSQQKSDIPPVTPVSTGGLEKSEAKEDGVDNSLGSKTGGPFGAKTGEIFRMPPEESTHTITEDKSNKVSLEKNLPSQQTDDEKPTMDPYREPID